MPRSDRKALRRARDEAELALATGRERARLAERVAQEAGFAERSCREHIAELNRRYEGIGAQIAQQQALVAQVADERRQIDWTPVEASLQAQLAARASAEQALAAARDRQESLGSEMRQADEARLTIDQRLDPARARIDEVRLKEQAAALSQEMYTPATR